MHCFIAVSGVWQVPKCTIIESSLIFGCLGYFPINTICFLPLSFFFITVKYTQHNIYILTLLWLWFSGIKCVYIIIQSLLLSIFRLFPICCMAYLGRKWMSDSESGRHQKLKNQLRQVNLLVNKWINGAIQRAAEGYGLQHFPKLANPRLPRFSLIHLFFTICFYINSCLLKWMEPKISEIR